MNHIPEDLNLAPENCPEDLTAHVNSFLRSLIARSDSTGDPSVRIGELAEGMDDTTLRRVLNLLNNRPNMWTTMVDVAGRTLRNGHVMLNGIGKPAILALLNKGAGLAATPPPEEPYIPGQHELTHGRS